MTYTSRPSEATITAENTFTDPIEMYGGLFNFSVSGTFVATVTIQRRFFNQTTETYTGEPWHDLEATYSTPYEDVAYIPAEGVQYRAGVKTGDFTSGSVKVRLSQ